MKTPSMIKEMRQKGERRISDAENKRRRKNWLKYASKEDKRLHEQNRLDMESAIERSKKKNRATPAKNRARSTKKRGR
tara:strand:+ start:244 stop:477 length:234 start_codon:yes stop_codon:yes gene_type:complete